MDITLQISLSKALKDWLDSQVARKGYESPSELVQNILEREQEAEARAAIDAQLLQSLDSGEPTPVSPEDWNRIRAMGRKLAADRAANK